MPYGNLEEKSLFMARKETSRGIFAVIPDAMKAKLLCNKKPWKFTDGQFLQHHGDDGVGFWVLKKGSVRIGRYLEHGQLQILLIVKDNDSFGELSCFSNHKRLLDGIAVSDVEAYWINRDDLMKAMVEFPESNSLILAAVATQLEQAIDILLLNRIHNASEKIRWNLKFFCSDNDGPISLPFSHHDVADMAGVSRMTVSKELKILEDEGILIREYGQLIILKPDLLAR